MGLLLMLACDDAALRPPPGEPCVKNSDCNDPLSCTFGLCHEACEEDRDCPTRQTCVFDPRSKRAMRVCQLPEEEHCSFSSDCPNDLVCGIDRTCRNQCKTSKDCATESQRCIDGTCAAPFDVVKDKNTGEYIIKTAEPKGDAGSAGREPAAGSGGETAGSGGSMGPAGAGEKAGAGAGGSSAGAGGRGSVTSGQTACGTASQASQLETFVPSNLPADFDFGTPEALVVPAWSCAIDTDALAWKNDGLGGCFAGMSQFAPRAVQMPAGGMAAVLVVKRFETGVDTKIRVYGERPLIVVATEDVLHRGHIFSARSPTSGAAAGGAAGPMTNDRGGFGPGAGLGASGKSKGAGGGAYCGRGGRGWGQTVSAMPYGNSEIVPLLGGSSGGSGQAADGGNVAGGAFEIVAGTSITITETGIISANGAGTMNYPAGSSGGAILLEAPSVTLRGTLTANGSAGAGGGGSGQAGSSNLVPARGSSNGGMQVGGDGSAGTQIDGADASNKADLGTGAGGGGIGRIRINTQCEPPKLEPNSVVSPIPETICYSIGKLEKR